MSGSRGGVRSGRLLAMFGDGLSIVRQASTALVHAPLPGAPGVEFDLGGIDLENVDDFACVDKRIWVAVGGKLLRFARNGDPVGEPTPLGDSPGRLIAATEQAAAIWRTESGCVLLSSPDDVMRVEELDLEVRIADFVALLSARRLLMCRGNTVRLHDIGRGDVSVGRLAIKGKVIGGAPIFNGQTLALLVQRNDHTHAVQIFTRGTIVRSLTLPATRHFLVAPKRGLAVIQTIDGEITVRDLRLDRLVWRYTPPFPVSDLVVAPDGSHIVMASPDQELPTIVRVPVAERGSSGQIAIGDLAHDGPPLESELVASDARASDDSDDSEDSDDSDDAAASESSEPDASSPTEPPTPSQLPTSFADLFPTRVEAEVPIRDVVPPAPRKRRVSVSVDDRADRGIHESVQRILEVAVCHVALLYERLYFISRNVGLLPRTTSADDPLGAIVISDSDVTTILAGLNRLKSVSIAERAQSIDPFKDSLSQSRQALQQALLGEHGARSGLGHLISSFKLDEVATDLLLLAISPDWDLRVTRLSGFLNNDATMGRPKMGHLIMAAQFGLPSISSDVLEHIERVLVAPGLVVRELAKDTPVIGQIVRCPDYIVQISTSLLESAAETDAPTWDDLRWEDEDKTPLRNSLRRELSRTVSQRLVVLEGPPGSGRMAMARAVAIDVGVEVEVCDMLSHAKLDLDVLVDEISRAAYRARVRGGMLIIRSDGVLRTHDRLWGTVWTLVTRLAIPCFVLVRIGELEGIHGTVRFVRYLPPLLQPVGRKQLWTENLAARGIQIHDGVLDDVSARYDITPGRLLEVADELQVRQAWQQQPTVGVAEMRGTLRDITVQRLTNLAARYDSKITLDDLVYQDSVAERIRELVHRIRYRHRVFSDWNFADKAHPSYGVSALFYGPPGTGKTAGAAAIANALEIDLYMVDFPSIMSKWIGETEQNLAKVFDEAEASSVALLFDEADAIFGKRSAKQESSSDRYANLTVNYLIQRMESFKGLAILTTNLESAMDEAFERRITARIRFPESDEKQRLRLWKHLLPRGATYDDDVDLRVLARTYKMEGAYIRRALTRAAFRAASNGRDRARLSREDLTWAALAEYEDMGRVTFAWDTRGGRDPKNIGKR